VISSRVFLAGLIAVSAALSPALSSPLGTMPAVDDAPGSGGKTLRVCASRNAPPFTTEDGGGFEDRIAAALATAMGEQLEIVRIDKPPIYLVRDALDQRLCEVIVGLDTGDPRVLTSKAYYRTGYVFVSRADRKLDVRSWNDGRLRSLGRIAVPFDSPGEQMLKQIGRYDDNLNYNYSLVNFKSRRNQYVQVEPARMVSEVASGNADLAVAFAPEVSRYVRDSIIPLHMTLIADDARLSDGARLEQDFDQSVGVRKDDASLLAKIDAALLAAAPQIHAILERESIPLLPLDASAPAAKRKTAPAAAARSGS